MSGVRVALDTNAAVHYLNDVEPVRRRVDNENGVAIPIAAVSELLFGALNSNRPVENIPRYEELINASVVLPADIDTARECARLRLGLKQLGRPIPGNDLWIAAACLQHGLILISNDDHFAGIPGLQVEDWTR